jgi:hypothetical protein
MQMFKPTLEKMQERLLEGTSSVSWLSGNLAEFCEGFEKSLSQIRVNIGQVSSIVNARVFPALKEIERLPLCFFAGQPTHPDIFYQESLKLIAAGATSLLKQNRIVEDCCEDCVRVCLSGAAPDDEHYIRESCKDFVR